MKCNYMLFSTICFVSAAFAAPAFVGVFVTRDATYVAVRADLAGSPSWVKIGDRVGGYRVASYDSQSETLLLRRDDEELVLKLPSAKVQPTPPLTLLESLIKPGDTELGDALKQARILDARLTKTAAELADFESRLKSDSRNNEEVTQLRRTLRLEEANLEYYLQVLTTAARDRVTKTP